MTENNECKCKNPSLGKFLRNIMYGAAFPSGFYTLINHNEYEYGAFISAALLTLSAPAILKAADVLSEAEIPCYEKANLAGSAIGATIGSIGVGLIVSPEIVGGVATGLAFAGGIKFGPKIATKIKQSIFNKNFDNQR